jgi:hypothetical protein
VTAAPDLAAPIAGWRLWHLGIDDDGPVLVSPLRPVTWTPRRVVTASCPTGCAEPPDWDCTCGLYATADLALLAGHRPAPVVLGATALWGRVVEATAGWRAERAYPLVLFAVADDVGTEGPGVPAGPYAGPLDVSLLRTLGERYGVPVHPLRSTRRDPLHPADPSVRQSRRWRGTYADVVADRPPTAMRRAADAVRHEAAEGLGARRLGDRAAQHRLDEAVEHLVAALRPEPPPAVA